MKKWIILALTDEELIELSKTILDEDKEEVVQCLQKHFKDKARTTLDSEASPVRVRPQPRP